MYNSKKFLSRTVAHALIMAFVVHMADVEAGGCVHDMGEIHAVGANITFSCDFSRLMEATFCNDTRIVIVEKSSERVPAHMLAAANRTLTMTMRNATAQQFTYRCMCGEYAVEETCIRVTSAPRAVARENFTCVSHDFDYVQCTFPNVRNIAMNRYNLAYSSRPDEPTTPLECKKDTNFVVCTTQPDEYQARRTNEHFAFHLTIANDIGAVHQRFDVNNLESVLPARPDMDCSKANRTADSVCFTWLFEKLALYAAKGLVWQADVTALNLSTETWPLDIDNTTYCLRNLPYAGYDYELELRLRVHAANSKWSEPFICKFRTAVDYPEEPLPAIPGGYYLYPLQPKFRVYWQDLPRHKQNGWNFSYVVTEYRINGILMNTSLVEIEGNSAIIEGWQWNATYEFAVKSRNENYDSIKASYVVIRSRQSSQQQKALNPQHLQYVKDVEEKSYKLSWTVPQQASAVRSYTVFWCKSFTLNECSGALQYVTLPGNATTYKVKQIADEPLTMAVSANYQYYNNSMCWPPCLSDTELGIEAMELSCYDKTSSTISFSWHMQCDGLVIAYNLTYCEEPKTGPVFNCETQLIHGSARSYRIEGLKAYTYYRANIFMMAERRNGTKSLDKVVKTKEGAPLSPRRLSCGQKTSSSVTLSWLPPQEPNGVIRGYLISVRGNGSYKEDYNLNVIENSMSVEYVLSELKAYTAYNVSVRAYTVRNSEPSNVLQITTDVGVPSEPVLHQRSDAANIILEWTKPEAPAGHLEFYEIEISECNHNGDVLRSQISYVMGAQPRTCQQKVPDCKGGHNFKYHVRAVNVGRVAAPQSAHNHRAAQSSADAMKSTHDELLCTAADAMSAKQINELEDYLHSPQKYLLHKSVSNTSTLQCPDATFSNLALILVAVVGFVLFLGYFLHIEIRRMANLKCVLPVGLSIKNLNNATVIGIITRNDNDNLGESLGMLFSADVPGYAIMQPKPTPNTVQPAKANMGYVPLDPSMLQCNGATADGYVKPDSTDSLHGDIPDTAKLLSVNNSNDDNKSTRVRQALPQGILFSDYVSVQKLQAHTLARQSSPPQAAPPRSNNAYVRVSDQRNLPSPRVSVEKS